MKFQIFLLIFNDWMLIKLKFLQGPHWKEAIKILKLAVARSSSLTSASSTNSDQTYTQYNSLAVIDVQHKKELPGRCGFTKIVN